MSEEATRAGGVVRYEPWSNTSNVLTRAAPTTISLTVFEREFFGKRIFTRELLETAAETVALARQKIDGKNETAAVVIKALRAVSVAWQRLQDMVEAGKAATPFKLNAVFSNLPSEEDQIACANTLTLEKTGLQKWARETPASEAQLRAFSDAREAWEATSQRASLRSELTAISDQHRIKNIVCNALGTLFTEDQSDFEPRDGGIHAAPPGLPAAPLEIVAYDPAYTTSDLQFLAQLPQPITIVSDPHHYLAITPETRVVCISHPVYVPVFRDSRRRGV
ncbi:hypothetical protein PMIN01_13191 [Paraphaeosphaeria minitans]|uniref:Uncharacterized protein n=1 Tax=Paraphaeosphaeria minitans TaxID=565426 RepID=A0A9P6G4A1_9PLEO|nr:hypothetical protein PMIN01_13191 [Paraphaeosphaeria minitans]